MVLPDLAVLARLGKEGRERREREREEKGPFIGPCYHVTREYIYIFPNCEMGIRDLGLDISLTDLA